jgi:integrase/recombinase XerD
MTRLTKSYIRKLYAFYLKSAGYKPETARWKKHALETFLGFLADDTDIREVGEKQILLFTDYLNQKESERSGKPLAVRTRRMTFAVVKELFSYLYQEELILENPLQDIKYQGRGEATTREILTREEMARLLDSIDEKHLRDRTMFELMYSSGLRCSEAAALVIGDIDFESRMLLVRDAKFSKDRIVPVSEVAMAFLRKHLTGRRRDKTGEVFSGSKGAIRKNSINRLFKKYLKKAGLYREGLSSHSIRHSVAVHLIAEGVDLRFVQELLDHDSIETTCTYTNDLVENIKRIYKTYAPRENEYYKEVDEAYLKKIEKLKREIEKQKEN